MAGLIVETALLGVALTASSPIAVMGVLVMMPSTPHGMRSAVAFVAGWCAALLVIGLAVIYGSRSVDFGEGSSGSAVTAGLQLGLGVASLSYAFVRYRRLRAGGTPPPPKWLARAGQVPPLAAFGLGALLPYYVVALACLGEILEAGVSQTSQLIAYLVFVAVTTGLLASPLLVVAFARDRSDERLSAMRAWLDRNSQLMITVLVAGIGVLLVVRGALGLLNN